MNLTIIYDPPLLVKFELVSDFLSNDEVHPQIKTNIDSYSAKVNVFKISNYKTF